MAETIETPAATVPDPTLLISRYSRVLEAAEEAPFVFLVRRRPGRLHWFGRTLRTRILLRFFVRWHIASTVAELRRAALGRAAAEPCEPCYAAVAERLEHFEKSLPTVRLRQALVVALVSVFLVAFLLARAAPSWDPTLSFLFNRTPDGEQKPLSKIGMRDAAGPLASMTGSLLTLNPREVGNALESFACRVPPDQKDAKNPKTVCSARRALISSVTSIILLGVAAWLVALIPAASFRLKRMLLNLDSSENVRQRVRSQVALEHVTCAKGIYRLEAELFGALGRRRPRELAIDLAGPACILVVPFWLSIMAVILGAYVLRYAISWGLVEGDLTLLAMIALGALAVAAFPAARLASLRWTQRSRAADAACDVPSVLANATLRRRLAAHVTDSLPFAGLGLLLIGDVSLFSASETGRLIAVFVICPIALAVVQLAFIARRGRTFGKLIWGLRVVDGRGNALRARRLLAREALLKGSGISVPWLLLPELLHRLDSMDGVPFWWLAAPVWTFALIAYGCAAWNLRRSPLHDLVLDSVVVRERRQPHGAAAPVLAPAGA